MVPSDVSKSCPAEPLYVCKQVYTPDLQMPEDMTPRRCMFYLQVVIMRGLNVLPSAKVPDFEPIKNLSTLDTIKPYGVNAVRQGSHTLQLSQRLERVLSPC